MATGNKNPSFLDYVLVLFSPRTEEINQVCPSPHPPKHPSSDGVMYGNFNEWRIKYEESERTDSQFSQFLSER
jgi:hypothetical protein